jgi:acyl-CoA dehydrogenase
MQEHKLMSAYVPKELGGGGVSLSELQYMCEALAVHCCSTAMVFAMHQIQVACMVHHAIDSAYYVQYLKDLVTHQYLIGSMTSEVGVGGEMRRSLCGLDIQGDRFTLTKDSTTISYGAYSDFLLITARRNLAAQGSDQILVLMTKKDYTLEQKGVWDTMGMRGTCSPAFLLRGQGHVQQCFELSFADIASQTMVPVSHLLWAGIWMGIAAAAVGKARKFVQTQARQAPGKTPPTALRLAEVSSQLYLFRSAVSDALHEYEGLLANDGDDELLSMSYALKMNHLKVAATQLLPKIVQDSLMICGILGFKNDSKFAMSRHIRDSLAGALMVGNDRILATNAAMLLVHKDNNLR